MPRLRAAITHLPPTHQTERGHAGGLLTVPPVRVDALTRSAMRAIPSQSIDVARCVVKREPLGNLTEALSGARLERLTSLSVVCLLEPVATSEGPVQTT